MDNDARIRAIEERVDRLEGITRRLTGYHIDEILSRADGTGPMPAVPSRGRHAARLPRRPRPRHLRVVPGVVGLISAAAGAAAAYMRGKAVRVGVPAALAAFALGGTAAMAPPAIFSHNPPAHAVQHRHHEPRDPTITARPGDDESQTPARRRRKKKPRSDDPAPSPSPTGTITPPLPLPSPSPSPTLPAPTPTGPPCIPWSHNPRCDHDAAGDLVRQLLAAA